MQQSHAPDPISRPLDLSNGNSISLTVALNLLERHSTTATYRSGHVLVLPGQLACSWTAASCWRPTDRGYGGTCRTNSLRAFERWNRTERGRWHHWWRSQNRKDPVWLPEFRLHDHWPRRSAAFQGRWMNRWTPPSRCRPPLQTPLRLWQPVWKRSDRCQTNSNCLDRKTS